MAGKEAGGRQDLLQLMHAVRRGEEAVLGHDLATASACFGIDDLINADGDDLVTLVEGVAAWLASLLQGGDEPEQALLPILGMSVIQLHMDSLEDYVKPLLAHRLEDV